MSSTDRSHSDDGDRDPLHGVVDVAAEVPLRLQGLLVAGRVPRVTAELADIPALT